MSEGVENTEVSYQWKWYFTDCPCAYIEIVTVKSSELLCVYCTSEHSRTTNKTDVEHCGVDEIMLSLLSMMCFCQSRLLENFLVITCATTCALMIVANRMVFWCDSNLKDVRTYFYKKGECDPLPCHAGVVRAVGKILGCEEQAPGKPALRCWAWFGESV